LVRKKGSRGPEKRNSAAACTIASMTGKVSRAPLSRSASTGRRAYCLPNWRVRMENM
jgi:hypothetical protein